MIIQKEEDSLSIGMYGIYAPERDQPYCKESVVFLCQYLHKDATIKANGVDRYGRILSVLYIDSLDINLLSINSGNAWHFRRYSSDQQYADVEGYARNGKVGLWSLPNPVPPCNWRRK